MGYRKQTIVKSWPQANLCPKRNTYYAQGNQSKTNPAYIFKVSQLGIDKRPNPTSKLRLTKLGVEVFMTLKQAYSSEYQRVQFAFKDSMIH